MIRRLLRYSFTSLAVVLLLLCAATAVLWVRSYFAPDVVSRGPVTGTSWNAESSSGRLKLGSGSFHFLPPRDGSYLLLWDTQSHRQLLPGVVYDSGHAVARKRQPGETPPFRTGLPAVPYHSFWRIELSHFWACVLLSALPALRLWRGRRWKEWHRRSLGLCLRCAYNLTGNTSGVCPECGTPVMPVNKTAGAT